MTLREFLFGGDDATDDHIDHYRVSHQRNGSGWKPVDGYDDLDDPITKSTFEYTEAPLDPGQYKLFAVKDNLHTQLPEGKGWKLTVEDETDDKSQSEEEQLRKLRNQIEELKAEQEQSDDIEQLTEERKAAAVLQVLQSPTFLEEHGDKVALSVLDVDPNIGTAPRENELEDEVNGTDYLAELLDIGSEIGDEDSETL